MINSHDCFICMGRRGSGKSYLGRKIQTMFPRRIIIDPVAEYSATGKKNNSFIVRTFEEYSAKLVEFKREKIKKFELIFQPSIEVEINPELFDEIMRLAYYYGNVQVVIEEVQQFATPSRLPHWLKNLMVMGRHQNISVLCTTQRPGLLNKTILSQCAHIFCGQLVEGNDLKYVANFLNQSADKLSNLPPRKFIYKSDAGIAEISNDFKT